MLPRSLLLAALLHVWLALMIGTRVGPALPGQSGWGSLNVTLRGPSGSAADGSAEADSPRWRDEGPPGEAKSTRHGGLLRREPPPPDSGPGAQSQGRWKPQALPPNPSRPEIETEGSRGDGALERKLSTPVEAAPAPSPEPAPRSLAEPVAAPRSADRPAAVEPFQPALPAAELQPAPARIELPPSESLLPSAARPRTATEALTASPMSLPATPLGELPSSLPEPPAPMPTPRTLAAPAPAPPRTDLQSLPSAAMPSSRGSQPPLVAPVPERAPSTLAGADTVRPRASTEALAVPRAQPASAAVGLNPLPAELQLPEAPPRTLEAPAASRPQTATPSLSVPPALTPPSRELSALPAPAPAGSTADALTAPDSAPLTRGDPLAKPVPGPRASSGAPDAGAQVGHDIATAPSAAASAPLAPLNLQLPRPGAGAMRRGPGMLELMPAPPESKSKLEKAIEEAKREDCRKAHGDKGLLAALPLAVDSLRGKGCKW